MSYTPSGSLPPARTGASGGTIPVGPDIDALRAAVQHLRSAGLALTTELVGGDGKLFGSLLPDSGVVDDEEQAAALAWEYGTLGTTDDTATIQRAIDSLAATKTGMRLQSSSGVFQAGADAPGGGRVVLPAGKFIVSTLVLGHRVELDMTAGTVLLQKAGTTGPVIKNRRDATVHASYCTVRGGVIDGNKAAQSAANHGIHFTGNNTFNYQDPLDEDYDNVCVIDGTYVMQTKGSGIVLDGAGANRVHNVKTRSCDGHGMWLGQDNHIALVDVGWSGLAGVRVDGESCTLDGVKAWYSGTSSAPAPGFLFTADCGAITGCNSQDNTGAGYLWDGAHGWTCSALLADRNSRLSPGTYPGFDLYDSSYCQISGVARNSFSGTKPQTTALRVRPQGKVGNVIDIVAAAGDWGVTTNLAAGSSTSGSIVRINGAPVTA